MIPRNSALMLLLGMTSLTAHAATQPDAGQTSREQQLDRAIPMPKEGTALPDAGAVTPQAAGGTTPVQVTAIRITGNRLFPEAELVPLVSYLVGQPHTLNELNEGVSRINAYYHDRGYFIANAYLPAQDITEGKITIAVQEGQLDQLHLDNTSRVRDASVRSHLDELQQGDAVQAQPLDRKLLLLRETPGIGQVSAALQPGSRPGTTDLLVETAPSAPYTARVQLDNYGNRYTGEYRVGVALALNSPLKLGDQLTLRAITSHEDMTYGRIAYQLPLGGDGFKVGAAYSKTRYRLGKEFAVLDAHGTATSGSVFASYPWILNQNAMLTSTLTYEDKDLKDRVDAAGERTDKQVHVGSIALTGYRKDQWGGAGVNSFDLTLAVGRLSMDAATRAQDDKTARSNGGFSRLSYLFNRLQYLTDRDTLSVSLSGQAAADNLNSSDKYSLGGPYGVRAYPQGEASGDEGQMLNLELRHRLMPSLQGIVFYDYGHIKINHENFSRAPNSRTIGGTGLGLNASVLGVEVNGYVAWPTQGGDPTSDSSSDNHSPRLWLQAWKEF